MTDMFPSGSPSTCSENARFASGVGDGTEAGDVAPVLTSPSPSTSLKGPRLDAFRDPPDPDADEEDNDDGEVGRDIGTLGDCVCAIAVLF